MGRPPRDVLKIDFSSLRSVRVLSLWRMRSPGRQLGFIIFALAAAACLAPAEPSTPPAYRKDRLIVRAMAPLDKVQQLHATAGTRTHRSYPRLGGIEVVSIPPGADFEDVRKRYIKELGAEAVQLDYIRTIQSIPNDPRYLSAELWGLNNTGAFGGTADADIDAPEAWAIRSEAPSIVVAVIDTGILCTHEDLAPNLWVNTGEIPGNRIDDDRNGYVDDVHGINAITGSGNPADDNGHGTHCAGTIGAVGNNGIGVAGVAWRVQLMGLKFLSADGSGSDSDAIECIQYALTHGAHILSNSWGGGAYNPALEDAIRAARARGVLFVAAAGNEASNNDLYPSYPASYALDNVVAVAATDRNDRLASFSNYGSRSVHIAAPGVQILSTHHTANGAYVTLSGTSMAAPHVSGALALLRAHFPGDSYLQILNRLYATNDRLPSLGGRVRTGGRLNLHRALATATPRPLNDNFSARETLTGLTAFTSADSTYATAEPLEPGHGGRVATRTLWWSWSAPSSGTVLVTTEDSDHDTTLGIYRGASLESLTVVASNDTAALPDGRTSPQAAATFTAVQGTPYAIAVNSVSAGGGVSLKVIFAAENDHFSERTVVSGDNFRVRTNNLAASVEPYEPQVVANRGGRSLWWQWTAPHTGYYLLSTSGSAFDTILGVFFGSYLSTLQLVAEDDDSGPSNLAELFFYAHAGATYQFVVDGYDGVGGDVELNLANLFNDDQFGAHNLVPGAPPQIGTNIGATLQWNDPDVAGVGAGSTVWWRWVPPSTALATIHTHGSDFDTVLGVYTRSSTSGFFETVAENDDFGGALTSLVTFLAETGREYWVCVDGYDGPAPEGIIALTLHTQALNPPTIIGQPQSYVVNPGRTVAFRVTATGDEPLSYSWTFGNRPISGNPSASTPILNVVGAGPDAVGEYRCVVSNAVGSVVSSPATLALTEVPQPLGRLVNLSVRADAGTGESSLIAGFVSAGGTARLLLRGVGPGLTGFGVTDVLNDPSLEVITADGVSLAFNDDWHRAPNAGFIATVGTQVGAFPLATGSRDAALLLDIAPMVASAVVRAPTSATGVALVEIYEAGRGAGSLRNVSARTRSGTGDSVLIAGFVIEGGPLTVLVRAAGPALRGFGVPDTLPDPTLSLYSGTSLFAQNDDWSWSPEYTRLAATTREVGAFPFAFGSRDSALLVTLPPGLYTALVDSFDGSSGVALVEVYAAE